MAVASKVGHLEEKPEAPGNSDVELGCQQQPLQATETLQCHSSSILLYLRPRSWSGTAQRGKDEPSRGGLGGPVVMLPGMGREMKTEPKGQWVDGYLWLLQPQQKLMTKMSFPVVMRC